MIGSVTKILKSHPDILPRTNKGYPIGIGSLITSELIELMDEESLNRIKGLMKIRRNEFKILDDSDERCKFKNTLRKEIILEVFQVMGWIRIRPMNKRTFIWRCPENEATSAYEKSRRAAL